MVSIPELKRGVFNQEQFATHSDITVGLNGLIAPFQFSCSIIPYVEEFDHLLGQWFLTLGHPALLELQLPEILADTAGGEGFLEIPVLAINCGIAWISLNDASSFFPPSSKINFCFRYGTLSDSRSMKN